jgi:hypothetical protein
VFHVILEIQSDLFPNEINLLIVVMELQCVYCEVEDEFVHIILVNFTLQRGSDIVSDE